MKTSFSIYFLSLLILFSCKKNEPANNNNYNPPSPKETITDIDGNTYILLSLFGNDWMNKNLDVSHFKNGDEIPHRQTEQQWQQAISNQEPAWCWYDNDFANGQEYGKLYNVYAVRDSRGLAPESCHVATVSDWESLIESLGGQEAAGVKLKSETGWGWNNSGGTDEYDFTALPGGRRSFDSSFEGKSIFVKWWAFDYFDPDEGNFSFSLDDFTSTILASPAYFDTRGGYYVRCVKD